MNQLQFYSRKPVLLIIYYAEIFRLREQQDVRENSTEHEAADPAALWPQTVSVTVLPGIRKEALHTWTMFESTYRCESAFSAI